MPDSVEARYLRAHWNQRALGQYKGKWIAVVGQEVIAADASLKELMQRMSPDSKPLYAFVVFGRVQ